MAAKPKTGDIAVTATVVPAVSNMFLRVKDVKYVVISRPAISF
ncbi:hypothetical protein SZ54_4903 [Rhizobium sp. UR51a]|nr:hypothetical protein SZ54_4903 [Rhizobium sp. UR51a]